MAPPDRYVPALTAQQRQAVRLEISGCRPVDIATQLGVTPETVQRWRRLAEYRGHRDMLAASSDADALDDARTLRLAASRLLRRGIAAVEEALEGGLDIREAVPMMRVVLDVYRATSAQTGMGETQRHEVTVSAPEAALSEMRRIVATVSDDGLTSIEQS